MALPAWRLLLMLALAWAFADPVQAGPTITIHWSDCTSTTRNRGLADGGIATVVVTAHGLSGVVRATQAVVNVVHRGYQGLPAAWRFDEAGCQAGRFHASTTGAAGCTFLASPIESISDFRIGETGGAAVFAMGFAPVDCDPATTYTIARFEFDFSDPACACADQAQCLHVWGSWLDESGLEHDFQTEQEFVTWEDPYATTCGSAPLCGNPADCIDPPNPCNAPTATRAGSWGSLKASYR